MNKWDGYDQLSIIKHMMNNHYNILIDYLKRWDLAVTIEICENIHNNKLTYEKLSTEIFVPDRHIIFAIAVDHLKFSPVDRSVMGLVYHKQGDNCLFPPVKLFNWKYESTAERVEKVLLAKEKRRLKALGLITEEIVKEKKEIKKRYYLKNREKARIRKQRWREKQKQLTEEIKEAA